MTFNIDGKEAKAALGVSDSGFANWSSKLPFEREYAARFVGGWGRSKPKQYRLADLVVALRQKRKAGLYGDDLRAVVNLAPDGDDPTEHLGEDSEKRAGDLLVTLTPEERARYVNVCKRAGEGTIAAFWGKTQHIDVQKHSGLIALRPSVLKYILTGERSAYLPKDRDEWSGFVASHILANATSEEITKLAN